MRPSTARRRTRAGMVPEVEGAPYLVFAVGGVEYALPLLGVQEMVPVDTLEALPDAPAALGGTLSLRGETVPVVDLAGALTGRKGGAAPERSALIAITARPGVPARVGFTVDDVRRVIALAPEAIAPPPRLGALVGFDLIAAMARVGEGIVPILDVDRLLASDAARAAIEVAVGRGRGGEE